MDYSDITKEEKNIIFEVVNSTHLHLKGDAKRLLKRQFTTWKINKNIGAFELFMKLYESEDEYDKMNEWWKQFVEDGYGSDYYRTHKPISYAKHRRHMDYRSEEIQDLEQKLEDVENGKGYIKQETHDDEILQLKKEWRNEKMTLLDDVSRLKQKLIYAEQDATARVNTAKEQMEYYKKQLDLLSIKD